MYDAEGDEVAGREASLRTARLEGDEAEAARLRALRSYAILDTPPEASFDAIIGFAAEICATPIALLSFHDAERQWFKARVGVDIDEAPRHDGFYEQIGASHGPLVVPDATSDARLCANPFVVGPPGIRFYAGQTLYDADGYRLGAICVIDTTPRPAGLSDVQNRALQTLAQQVVTQLALRREVRQREAAERKLRHNERRLEARFEELEQVYRHAPVGLVVLDRDYRCLRLNDRMAAIDGVPAERQIGRTIREIAPDLADQLMPIFARVIETGEPATNLEVEGETVGAPGVHRFWVVNYFPMRDDEGAITGLIGAVLEVTDRRNAERALAKAQERLALALDSAEEGHWDWNVATGEVWFSDQWQRILGMDPGTMTPRIEAWERLIHPDDLPDLRAALREHMDGLLDRFESEHRMRGPDGKWLWVLNRGKVVAWSGDGKPLRLVGTHRNIAQRKRAEEERLFAYRLTDALRDVSVPEQRLELATRLLREQLGVAQAGFGEIDQARGTMFVARDSNDGRLPSVAGKWRLADFGPDLVRDAAAGATVVIRDVLEDPRTASPVARAAYAQIDARAVLVVPLLRDGELIAVLFLHHSEPRDWSDGEIALVEATCERLWSAVERARTEERLHASQELLAQALRVGGLGVFEHDHLAETLFWSPTMRDIVGVGSDAPISIADYVARVHPDDVSDLAEAIERARQPGSGGLCDSEHRLVRGPGDIRHVFIRSQTFFDGEPDALKLKRTVGVIQDVTERTEAAAALRKNEALLGAVLDALPVGVVIADADGKLVRDNGAHRALWARTGPVDAVGPESWAGWWPRSGRRIRQHQWPLARAYLQREIVRGELIESRRFADGEHRFVLNSAAPVVDEEGALLGAVAAELDVTDAFLADRRMRETEERYRLAVSATQDTVWDWDLERDVVVWSDAITDRFGYRIHEIPPGGDWWKERIHPDDRDRVAGSFDAVAASNKLAWSAEYRFRRADGSYAHVLDRGTMVRDASGRAVRAIGAMLDLTERKAAEAELRQAHEDLLRISRLTAMGAVASTLAHELNQPLTATNNLLTLVRIHSEAWPDTDGVVRRAIEKASSEILRAGEIVRRIRRFASTGELSRKPESLAGLIGRAWESVAQLPQAAGFRPELRLDADADMVEVDRVQIEQVLNNLLRNAIEAMAETRKRHLGVTSRLVDDAVELCVCDSGAGFTPEARAHLFEPFRSSKVSGLGLGLPLCRTIVEAHGGRIWAEDRPGGGARFMLTLPRVRTPDNSG